MTSIRLPRPRALSLRKRPEIESEPRPERSRPEVLLTQNSELRRDGIYNWTLPAFHVELSDGSRFNACPSAGVCARVCYARFGTYRFSNVARRHLANLEYVLEEPDRWFRHMDYELDHPRFHKNGRPHRLDHDPEDVWLADWIRRGGPAIRIHDAGDFFSESYFDAWRRLADRHLTTLFYAYTKEVSLVGPRLDRLPPNFRIIFSYGGLEDHLIDRDRHRHADVFPTLEALLEAGYYDQGDSDLLAVTAPTPRIWIVANNIPAANKRFAGRPMSDLDPRLHRSKTS